ncbi:hypothetical protein EJ08DRAFT_630622 [Tothia fuscella]|uniref:Metallo-beta-lactamase domain-containing protein n=1 Tax=Tothia fuscella TaxID=1048955 RepID=A0A9P4NVA3_9PEZI|nr:hypothetical protein EJ08DRAFT_630622 [Tothia fuscella]
MGSIVPPKPAPELNIPAPSSTVDVSIIDSTVRVTLPMSVMVKPTIGNHETVTCPCYCFLIQHPSGRTLVFELAVRKGYENLAPSIVSMLKGTATLEVEKDVATILKEINVLLESIEGIVWRRYHMDHIGNPATFPSSTVLIVGPGFKNRFPHAYPTVEKSPLTEDAWQGRELCEISFAESSMKVGRFKAFDYFGDGSFYLLDTPGHLLGHMCGLARTTTDTYILMGGDAAHHAGEFRPTEYVPLPKQVSLVPNLPPFSHVCPGEVIANHLHPEKSATKPFYKAADGFQEDDKLAEWSIEGLCEFDADERMFTVIAHDLSLIDVVEFYPKGANDWYQKGWAKTGHWRFLADYSGVLEAAKNADKLWNE